MLYGSFPLAILHMIVHACQRYSLHLPHSILHQLSPQIHCLNLCLYSFPENIFINIIFLNPIQFSSVTQSCPTPCNPMNHSTPGLPVYHQLPESTQTHVHWIGDALQPPHPLSSPSPPALNLSQDQGLFKWVSSLHQVAKVLEFQLQHQSFKWTQIQWTRCHDLSFFECWVLSQLFHSPLSLSSRGSLALLHFLS